jgi:hypothetical protein
VDSKKVVLGLGSMFKIGVGGFLGEDTIDPDESGGIPTPHRRPLEGEPQVPFAKGGKRTYVFSALR